MKLPRRVKKLLARRRNVVLLVPLLLLGGTGVYAGLGGFTDPPLPINLEQGLVANWEFSGNTQDSTANNYDLTLFGAPPYVADRSGNANAALGISEGTQWAETTGIDIGNDWTISVWSPYPNSGLEETSHWRTLTRGAAGDHQVIVEHGGNRLGTYDNTGGTGFKPCAPSFNVNTLSTGWHQFTVTQTGGSTGTMIFYVDAKEVCRINGYGSTTDIKSVGGYMGGGQEWGSIDDSRVYNRALNTSEVGYLYTGFGSSGQGKVQVADTQKGLLGHWKFDGNTKDAMPNANHGTINGGATLSGDRKGKSAAALNIANSNQYVSVGTPATYANLTTTGFSYSVWLMRSGASTFQWPVIMGANNPHVYYSIRSLNYGDNIVMEYGISPYDGASWGAVSAGNLPINEWHLFTFTYDGTSLRSYKDGILAQTVAAVLNPTTGPINFGGTGGTSWQGSLDDARIYKRPLSLSEIQRLYDSYDANVVVSDLQKGLVGHWSMDGNAKDATPYASNGTVTGATLVADRRGRSSSAYNLVAASNQYITLSNPASIKLNSFSLTGWFKTSTSHDGKLFSLNVNYHIIQVLSNYVRACTSGCALGTTNISDDQWHFIAIVGDDTSQRVYLDGNTGPEITFAASSLVPTGVPRIGAVGGNDPPTYLFNGSLDDFRLYNRPLSPTEVRRLYDSY